MRRTILGLFTRPAKEEISSTIFDETSALEVNEVQEGLDGLRVYSGEAALVTHPEREVPVIGEDGTITMAKRTYEDRLHTEWFAVPDANPGFVCVDSSDGEFAFTQIARVAGGFVDPAAYDLEGMTDYFLSEGATFWQVGWSDGDEAGTWYPDPDDTNEITNRGLRQPKNQIGFNLFRDGQSLYGTCASSGYLELYRPSHWEALEMAAFIREEMLQFSGVPDVGPAEDFAEQSSHDDHVKTCDNCGREPERGLHDVDGEEFCIVCADKSGEDSEASA